jgi:hypothetical protein
MNWQPIKRNRFLDELKKEKQSLQRKEKKVFEDIEYSQTLNYRIELINLLIVSFQGIKNKNSLKNLNHKPRF